MSKIIKSRFWNFQQTTHILSCRIYTDKFSFLEVRGLEPLTYGLQSHRSSQLSYTPEFTVGLLLHAVSKLAYMMQKVELFREYPAKLTSHVSSKKKEGGATSVAKELGEYV